MKIIITSTGDTIDSKMDLQFGRSKFFTIVDIKDSEIINTSTVDNIGATLGHGAGTKAAQQVKNLNADYLITGNLGPKAFDLIETLNIPTFRGKGTIKESIEKFLNNELEKITTNIESPNIVNQNNNINNETNNESKERIFLPLLDNNGLDSNIAHHFGHAPFFGLYDFKTKKLSITKNKLDHSNPNLSPIDQIIQAVNPTMIFAQGIGAKAIKIINEKKLTLKTGNYSTIQEVLNNLENLDNQTKDCGHKH